MTVVLSGGRTVPVVTSSPNPSRDLASQLAGPGHISVARDWWLAGSPFAAAMYPLLYRRQPWVFAAVNKLAFAVAELPLQTFITDVDGTAKADRTHPLARILRNPFRRQGPFTLKLAAAWSLLVQGHALLLIGRQGGRAGADPTSLWPVPWDLVDVIEQDLFGPTSYAVTTGLGPDSVWYLDPTEVVHLQMPGGVSPLEPLARTLELDAKGAEWQQKLMDNGAVPRGAFTTEQKLHNNDIERMRQELAEVYAGVSNAGRFGIFHSGLRYEAMSQSIADTGLLEQRKFTREEVAGVYDVAPPLIGLLDRATFSNITTLKESLYVDTLAPRLKLIEDGLDAQLVEPTNSWDGTFVRFNADAKLRPSTEARMRSYLLSQQASVTTVNERRKLEDLPPLDDPLADAVMIPLNMGALGAGGLTLPGQFGPESQGTPGGTQGEGVTANLHMDRDALIRAVLGDTGGSLTHMIEQEDDSDA